MESSIEIPYRYPKFVHTRRLSPGPYTHYKTYKPYLRTEFENKCIYCRRPDTNHPNDKDAFGVDHYWPQQHFPDLECDYSNLYYACNKCNSYKDDYFPASPNDPFIPNPCDHIMIEHVRFEHGEVKSFSQHGEFMTDALHLNEQELVEYRIGHECQVRGVKNELRELEALQKRLKKRNCLSCTDEEELTNEIEKKRKILMRLCGYLHVVGSISPVKRVV
jgi:hypothetical protein